MHGFRVMGLASLSVSFEMERKIGHLDFVIVNNPDSNHKTRSTLYTHCTNPCVCVK